MRSASCAAVLFAAACGFPLIAGAAESPAGAADYPNKTVRLIVPAPAGSGPDANARVLIAGLARPLGQQLVIDNRPGASGIIGTQLAARSVPDGYTLLLGIASVFAAVPTLYDKLPFDLDRDFIPISTIELIPCALVVNPGLPAKTIKEFIALAKAQPGQLTFGSGGNGSFHHLSAEMFKTLTGTDMRHIPYGTGGPYSDLVSGQLPLMFDTLSPFLPNVKAGKLCALAVSGKQRRPQAPDCRSIPRKADRDSPLHATAPQSVPRLCFHPRCGAVRHFPTSLIDLPRADHWQPCRHHSGRDRPHLVVPGRSARPQDGFPEARGGALRRAACL